MTMERSKIEQARTRLAHDEPARCRDGSVTHLVRELLPEIHDARQRGKSWEQITLDIADGEELKHDTVRQAYGRLKESAKGEAGINAGRSHRKVKAATTTAQAKPAQVISRPEPSGDAGLFAPMFDARDTMGLRGGKGRS